MNSENKKISDPHILLLNVSDKIGLTLSRPGFLSLKLSPSYLRN